jgi:hypothetical protein
VTVVSPCERGCDYSTLATRRRHIAEGSCRARENRRFSSVEKRPEDFFHGL